MSMRYFEVNEPYYALLKAKNPDNAKAIYTKVVGTVEPVIDELLVMNEVPVEYASIAYSQSLSQKGIPVERIVDSLKNRTEMILTVDGCVA